MVLGLGFTVIQGFKEDWNKKSGDLNPQSSYPFIPHQFALMGVITRRARSAHVFTGEGEILQPGGSPRQPLEGF